MRRISLVFVSLFAFSALTSVIGCSDGLDPEQAKVRCDQERAARGAFVTDEAYQQCLDCHEECGDNCRVSSDAVPQFTCPAE
jgi:hypothetical protein